MPTPAFTTLIQDSATRTVLKELYTREYEDWNPDNTPNETEDDGAWGEDESDDPFDYPTTGFSISPEQGDQFYLLARHSRPSRIVEFATSLGFSTLYFAAALRDNGGGILHTAEIVPAKAEQARRNLERAGLADYVDIRIGDARDTLRHLPGDVDLALIDGWPSRDTTGLDLDVLRLIEPRLRPGAIVLNDNHEDDYLAYVRDRTNGYLTATLPSGSTHKHGTELSLRH